LDSSARLLRLADENLAEAHREQARWMDCYRIDERPDALFVAADTRFPAGPLNSVLLLGTDSASAQSVVDRARGWYSELDRGFTIFVRKHNDSELERICESQGLPKLADSPGMVLNERPATRALGAQAAIRTLELEDASAFIEVAAAAYESMGMAGALTRKLFSRPERWLSTRWHVEVVFEADEPVAGAMLLVSPEVCGVYWVGTVPSARGRGHADAVMRSISNHAFDRGARAVILQASPFGEPVYRRMGYREITRYPWYLVARS
jgi:GNAT superfamily N-acetyltransferase